MDNPQKARTTGFSSQAHEGRVTSDHTRVHPEIDPGAFSTYKSIDDQDVWEIEPRPWSFIEVAMVALAPFVAALAALSIHSLLQ